MLGRLEWIWLADRDGVRAEPLPSSLADPKREISEKKWVEAQPWAGGSRQGQQEFQAAE